MVQALLNGSPKKLKRTYGDSIPSTAAGKRFGDHQATYRSHAITPWNFPIAMITRKAAPALCCRL
ncbi:aldehyde dehydrogenase family protein [Vibrio lentus]|nr:aldehyde dehydrogenase family protein [Vibrio lentus]